MMFLLLLAIAWSADYMTPLKESCGTTRERTCSERIMPVASVPLYIRFSAEVTPCPYSMEPVTQLSWQKAVTKQRNDIIFFRPEHMRPSDTARPKRSVTPFHTADYYVFSLERIIV